ncbi:MAG: type II secretion system F family protein [Opitutales bacterium]|nr:type II secretion system F family protein [Opitutales bacterium]
MPSLKVISQWYLECGLRLKSGISLPNALLPAPKPIRPFAEKLSIELQNGASWDKLLDNAEKWIPESDRFMLSAASETGKLPDVFMFLSREYEQKHDTKIKLIGAMIYPLLVLHMASGVAGFTSAFINNPETGMPDFATCKIIPGTLFYLSLLWGSISIVALFKYLKPQAFRKFLTLLPLVGRYMRQAALSRYAYALEHFVNAGIPLREGFFGAGTASGDPALLKASISLTRLIDEGKAPALYIHQFLCFPEDYSRLIQTGLETGTLDENLEYLGREYGKKAVIRLAMASFWYPKLAFLGCAVFVGWKVVAFYSTYLNSVMKLTEM